MKKVPHDFACPKCGAERLYPCLTMLGGDARISHQDRVELAHQANDAGVTTSRAQGPSDG